MFYEVCCLSNNKDYVSQLSHFTGLHFWFVSLVLSSFHYKTYKKENTSHFTSLIRLLLSNCSTLLWSHWYWSRHYSTILTLNTITNSPASRVRVRVTLRLTVGQSVSLGVQPNLGLLTRDIIFFFEGHCPVIREAPSLTRGRVCHVSVFCQYSISCLSISFSYLYIGWLHPVAHVTMNKARSNIVANEELLYSFKVLVSLKCWYLQSTDVPLNKLLNAKYEYESIPSNRSGASETNILSRDWVSIDGVCVGNRIYWTL
jgi:hypothetical protein